MKRKLLVISIDSMVKEDLPIMEKLPNFRRIMDESSIVETMQSTYPTLTHSIHTSIFTGCYPGHHKVINNEQFVPGNLHAPWYEDASLVQAETLPDAAKAHGYSTAYIYWPLTMHADHPWVLHRAGIHSQPENIVETIRQRSTPGLLDEVWPFVKDSFSLPRYYSADAFCFGAADHILRTYQPDITYIHLVVIDHTRHAHGVFSEELRTAYQFLDDGLGVICKALEDTGLLEQTIINITSDHGHLDIQRVVSLNRFFRDKGLLSVNADGSLKSWQAYAHSCSLSSQVYIKDADPAVCARAKQLLWDNRTELGISEILDPDELERRYHTGGGYCFMVETDGVTSFASDYNMPLVNDVSTAPNSDYRFSRATHGHMPEKGVQPAFILRNPFSSKRVRLPREKLVDQAPTLARLLGFTMEHCDGAPIPELLEE